MALWQSLATNSSSNVSQHLNSKQYNKSIPIKNSINAVQPKVISDRIRDQGNNNPVNNILLSGLGASLGGAIAGGFIGSLLQTYFSNKSVREKDHLLDLKRHVVEPLVATISNTNFSLSDFKFNGFRFETNGKLESDDVLFQDFLENHYTNTHTQLNKVLMSRLDLANKEHHLLNRLKSDLLNVFSNITLATDNQGKNDTVKDVLAQAILDNRYDSSYLRIADYTQNRYLYFYPVEDSRIPFSEGDKYVIFSSATPNQEFNTEQVNRVRSDLIQGINSIVIQMSEQIKDYANSKNDFIEERKQLLQRLLELKYSTRLDFEKKNFHRQCSLT